MKLRAILGVCGMLITTHIGADQPSCRWLNSDNARVYQCSVVAETEVAAKPAPRQFDGMPDPTLPLSEQQALPPKKDTAEQRLAVLKPATESTSQAAEQSQFIVLGLGNIESNKAKLVAVNDGEFAFLPTPNRLSLGVFSNEENAVRRQSEVSYLGIQSEIRPFTSPRQLAIVKPRVEAQSETTEPEHRDQPHLGQSQEEQPRRAQTASPQYVQLAISYDDPTLGAFMKAVRESTNETAKSLTNKQESGQTNQVNGYIVASVGDAKNVLKQLTALNVEDYVLLKTGPYKERVSVGVFSSLENALSRQAFFSAAGIRFDVISRRDELVVQSPSIERSTEEHSTDEQSTEKGIDKSAEKKAKPRQRHYDQIALVPLDI